MTAPADKGKKAKTEADGGEENEQIDGALVLSIEKLQEIQDELEKVSREPLLPLSGLFLGLSFVRRGGGCAWSVPSDLVVGFGSESKVVWNFGRKPLLRLWYAGIFRH